MEGGEAVIDLRLGDWHDVLADVECDALIVDPPYGERTHVGHDASAVGHDASAAGHHGEGHDGADRKALDYGYWTERDVVEFVKYWSPRCRGQESSRDP